ncbi:MAG: DUF2459 domain-containing protein [Pseudomonadota bacterium]|nr:DUF2459 domain-containing protein [Pseudomonadota bacterium]
MHLIRLLLIGGLMGLSSCAGELPPPCSATKGHLIYVVEAGWHAELGLPVTELGPELAFYRDVFRGAQVLMVGYGKQTFFTAPPDTISEYFLGPVPGPAVIHVVGLSVTPFEAYAPGEVVALPVSAEGARQISREIWKELSKDATGQPRIVARSHDPDGLFYSARSEYNLFHTCNTWTAHIMETGGLPVSGDGVVFSGQVMTQVNAAARDLCRAP